MTTTRRAPKRRSITVRRRSPLALILIDVINHFQFPDGRALLEQARPIAPRIARLKERARDARVPVIYVNDNFGQWRSNAAELLQYCLRREAPGRGFVEPLRPTRDDYLLLKPMHSAFYQTPLDILLRRLGSTTLIVAGLATNSCVVCTAHDADMRDFELIVPSDCCAARSAAEHRQALAHVEAMAGARVLSSPRIRLR